MCNGMTPEKNREKIKSILRKALDKLYDTDKKNIKDGVSERNLCARLAMYIEQEMKKSNFFDDYYADVEYNRQRKQDDKSKTEPKIEPKMEPKTEPKTESDMEPKKMVCDLLIHSRGEKEIENFLALEMKKKPVRKAEKDKNRLIKMTRSTENDYSRTQNTLLGAFVVIGKDSSSITYYEEGEEKEKEEKDRNVEEEIKEEKRKVKAVRPTIKP